MTKMTINVEGMSCEHCVSAVKSALEGVDGVKKVKVSLKKKDATIKYDEEQTNMQDFAAVVADAGFSVVS